ncbi:DUF896 domain-containing protein [Massiliimalia massiliensis]|jgi:uncharacterized protein YnzC (UPF0291/DUF896 family)|uniref:DUF896 domain-containing protein n=1 Tax=Massiliimalia massiliensis TaxID=1852384 RepID=UPI000987ABAB|nr:DUF896 domain-containing protein [Massiliimalia massiliensis]MBS1473712.1 DUF896 domain-containing protein [Massiliimalia sp.]
MEDYKIKRINELAKKARETGLTKEEQEEQQRLRREYIDAYKKNLRAHLEYIKKGKDTNLPNS